MFSFFKKDPIKDLQKKRAKILEKSVQFQRSGDLRTYAKLIEEAEEITKEIEKLEKKS
jgi:hypothetical protein